MENLTLSVARFFIGLAVSAIITVAGVWFVVDNSLRGIETAVEVTNDRIGSIESKMVTKSDLEVLAAELRTEFAQTREAI